jgi:hypothetical protein
MRAARKCVMCVNMESSVAAVSSATASSPAPGGGVESSKSDLGIEADLEAAAVAVSAAAGEADGSSDSDAEGGGGGGASSSVVDGAVAAVAATARSDGALPQANAMLRDLALARAARAPPAPPAAADARKAGGGKAKGKKGGGGGGSAAAGGREFGLSVVAVRTEADIEGDDDALLDALVAARTRCAAVGCKASVQTLSTLCKFCGLKFCIAHGQVCLRWRARARATAPLMHL